MEVAEFERVYEDFRDFHAFFAPTFGRKQWREHSGHYLQDLLVQSQERRNAENLAETVPVSARTLQRFLTEARWDDEAVTAGCRSIWAPGWRIPWRYGDSVGAISPNRGSSPWG